MEENETLFLLTDVRDKKEINDVRKDLKNRAEGNPESKILIFYACAGHGMQIDGEQVLVVNQCNVRYGYYEWWNIEGDIRRMAKKFPNTYSVAIFACCREIYRPTKHCGLFGGTQEDAEKYFKHIAPIEYALEATASADMKKKKKELEVEKFK